MCHYLIWSLFGAPLWSTVHKIRLLTTCRCAKCDISFTCHKEMIRHRKEAHLEDIIKAVRWEFCLTFYDVTKCHKEMIRHRKEVHLEDIIRAVRWDIFALL